MNKSQQGKEKGFQAGGTTCEKLWERECHRDIETERQRLRNRNRERHGLREPDTDEGEAGAWLFQGLFVAPVGGTWWLGVRCAGLLLCEPERVYALLLYHVASRLRGEWRADEGPGIAGSQDRGGYKNRICLACPEVWSESHYVLEVP